MCRALAAIIARLNYAMVFPSLLIALTVWGQSAPPLRQPVRAEPIARNAQTNSVAASELNQRLLDLHNAARREVGVPPLVWSSALADQARTWGQSLLASERFEHDSRRGFMGENLWSGWGHPYPLERMVADWTDERAAYVHGIYPDVRRPGDVTVVGHYTQMVWRDTTDVGCALVEGRGQRDRRNRQILVCRYSPPGNVRGQTAY